MSDDNLGDLDNPLGRVTLCPIWTTSFYFENDSICK